MKFSFSILLLIMIMGQIHFGEAKKRSKQLSDLFHASSQIFVGWSEAKLLKGIHELCASLLEKGFIKPGITPDMDKMSLRFHSPSCKETSVPLSQAEKILEIPEFDLSKKVAIFVTGWMSSKSSYYAQKMAFAFHCRGGYNFLALNTSGAVDTLYEWSAFNTKEIGFQLANALEKFANKIPIENVYLIGHSLGAHIVGYTARFFKQSTKSQLLRITGLDPANPCFNGNKGDNRTLPGIRHGDAAFVDIIHTNPGAFGEPNSIGNADFYVGGFLPIQSGCFLLGCSHTRAIKYFTESVFPTYGRNFLAAYCPFANIKKNDCHGPYEHTMGITSPNNLNGTYFLKVNSKPPYGKNIKYYKDVKKQCGIC